MAVGDLDLERVHHVVAVVQHLAVDGGRVLGVAQTVDRQLGGRGAGLDGAGQVDGGVASVEVQIDGEAWQVVGQEQCGAALEDKGVAGAQVSHSPCPHHVGSRWGPVRVAGVAEKMEGDQFSLPAHENLYQRCTAKG